ncbi:hypothetical protein PR202_ga00162 [Eleusine coracana subsp. coracana]|uniref:Protein TIFY n=1 Tax=Eleusine coracana subsp. coracana TaxID=191504 RepID=A0AAV5BCZ3_ELECO|nr:hypothetical protein QOZ80_2AG0123570 [Eleusine coracana subsp. coracana]GJM84486.1 hypothetical protein PR202_ga00162 [Eleusine coracana subsp. coracana]
MPASDCSGHRRFAVACAVLSQCVKAETSLARPTAALASASTMLLMPGADVGACEVNEEPEPSPEKAEAAHQAQQNQMTILYGGRVLVFDDVPADRAAELMMRVAAAWKETVSFGCGLANEMQVASKASLRRFMEKRKDRLAARAPYGNSCSEYSPLPPASGKRNEDEIDGGCWLGLGVSGGCRR